MSLPTSLRHSRSQRLASSETAPAARRARRKRSPAAAYRTAVEGLESRTLMTIVQPAGQDFLAFEAEHPERVVTLGVNESTWNLRTGSAVGNNTVPTGGAALQTSRNGGDINAAGSGTVTYPIRLTAAGPYFFYARVKYGVDGDNSMFVPADGGPVNGSPDTQWDNRAESLGDYHWNNLNNANVSFDYTNPTPGADTTISLRVREN